MSYKAHLLEEKKVQYDTGVFNHCYEELADFINSECENSNIYNEFGYVKDQWEIPINDFKKMITNIEENFEPEEYIIKDYTVEDCQIIFKHWLNLAEKNRENYTDPDYIYIEWF